MDKEEFGIELEKLLPKINALARYTLRNPSDIEEAVQESCLKAFNAQEKFREAAHLKTWLWRITVNACYDLLRKKRARTTNTEVELLETSEEIARRTQVDPAQHENLQAQERALFLRQAIATLSSDERAVIQHVYFEGLSAKETAEALNSNENAIRTRIFRARAKLKKSRVLREGLGLDTSGSRIEVPRLVARRPKKARQSKVSPDLAAA